MKGHRGLPILRFALQQQYSHEDKVRSQRALFSRHVRGGSLLERKMGVDISSNYASSRLTEVPFNIEDNFL